MQKATPRLLIVALVALGLVFTAGYGRAGEAKQALESALVGMWKVPENKYQEEISFNFAADRTFECVHVMPKKEPVTWSGNWKVRTTSSGAVKAYLKARSQSAPEQYMKAIVTCDKALEVFAVDIVFNFKSPDKSNWSSKLERASDDEGGEKVGGDEEDGGDDEENVEEDAGDGGDDEKDAEEDEK